MREEDFERLYAEQAAPLLAFLTYRTGNPVLADDLLADTFERALRRRRLFDRRRASEKTWLYSIALNVLRDHARRAAAGDRALKRLAAEPPPVTSRGLDALENRDELQAAFELLSPEEQEAVALRFAADLSLDEIARATHEPGSTVRGRLYRGLDKMRSALEET
jgi:RNA polymerase sigma-70 factor (ECF subfamily)